MLRDAVRVLADERVAPRAAEIDKTGEFPEDMRRLLADHDILALPFPTEHGGLGGELLSICLAVEQLSRACATTGLILAVQELGSLPITIAGTAEQQARWFPKLASGEHLIAFALTEAEAGSDAAAARTTARPGRRRLCHRRIEALHQPGLRRRPRRRLRRHGARRPASRAAERVRGRGPDRRLRGQPGRAQDGHPRQSDRRARLRRRCASRRRTGSAKRATVGTSRCGRSTAADRASPPRRSASRRARWRSRPPTPASASSSGSGSATSRRSARCWPTWTPGPRPRGSSCTRPASRSMPGRRRESVVGDV